MSTETIHKPIQWWNSEIKLDWGKLFSVMAKTAIKTASGKFDEAWEEAVGGAEAIGASTKSDPQVLTWLLINRALARSVFALLSETRARNPGLPYRTEGDGAAVINAGRLMPTEFEVRRDFLNRPETLPFLGDVRAMLINWFVDLGIAEAEARALAGRIDGILPRELREEWRRNVQTWQPIKTWFETPVDDAVRRQDAWDRSISKIKELPAESVFGESFALHDIYVRLRAYTVQNSVEPGRNGEFKKPIARLGWLHDAIVSWIEGPPDRDDALRVISGGPGSGKSSAARMLAAELADRPDLRVLYVPLHRVHLGGVLREALARYCKTWVFDDSIDPVDALEPHRRLVLFLDGLDELTSSEHRAAQELASQFAAELRTFLAELNQFEVRALAIVGGRELAVQSTAEARFRQAPVLHVFPFAADRELRDRFDWRTSDASPSLDQRAEWWRRFATITGAESHEMPTAVSRNERLLALTEHPLLNYLVASFARRHGSTITPQTSVADVYDALIHDVYERVWRDVKEAPTAQDLAPRVVSPEQFFAVLEEIALAVWHGNGRGAALTTIQDYLETADLAGLIQAVQSKLEGGISNLLLTFFFRKEAHTHGTDYFEFTHKSFQEYLTARRILAAARNLARSGKRKRGMQSALAHWVEATGPAMITREIAEFMDHEAGRNTETAELRSDREALCFLFGYQLAEGLPVEDAWGPAGTSKDRSPTRFGVMREWSSRAELALLAAIAALAPRIMGPHVDAQQVRLPIALPHATALKALFERLAFAEVTNNGGGNFDQYSPITARSIHCLSFVVKHWDINEIPFPEERNDKSALFLIRTCLQSADLRWSDLSGADMRCADLKDATLAGLNLCYADVRDADLRSADLRYTRFQGTNLTHTLLRRANVEGADFRGALLDEADFADAKNLPKAIFSPGVREALSLPPATEGNPERDVT